MIDLHCHSYFSDGALSPNALLEHALKAGVNQLALTDHDTTAGLAQLHLAAQHANIRIINGIEFSTRWKKYDIHILGLNISPDDVGLCSLIALQNESRVTRALQISARLLDCGVVDAYQKACEIAGHERVGRPHFAQVLVNEGRVLDLSMAFKRYLGSGRVAYVATPWLSIETAVKGIVQAGGQAVIAHPLKYGLTRSKLYELISVFTMAGGVGMEVVSGEMTVTQINEAAGICLRFKLLASSGSDFHGHTGARLGLGRQQPLPLHCTPIWTQWN